MVRVKVSPTQMIPTKMSPTPMNSIELISATMMDTIENVHTHCLHGYSQTGYCKLGNAIWLRKGPSCGNLRGPSNLKLAKRTNTVFVGFVFWNVSKTT